MKHKNLNANGTPRLGRPTGPTSNRGNRPWDAFDKVAILTVAANPNMPRWKIADSLGISLSKLSTITCSPRGAAYLEEIATQNMTDLRKYFIGG